MRRFVTLCPALLVAPSVIAIAAPAEAATAPSGPESSVRRVGFHAVAPASARSTLSATAAPATGLTTGTVTVPSGVAVIGFTWDDGAAARLMYRVERGGVWGAWERVEAEVCDDCAAPGAASRAGSAPIVLTGATRVEARIVSGTPVRPRLAIVDPRPTAADAAAHPAGPVTGSVGAASLASSARSTGLRAGVASTARVPAPAGLGGPRISMPIKRAGWKASSTRLPAPLPAPRGVVVHHTAGSNAYTRAQVPGILRGIQRFHIEDRGWGDIGYNALVDRFGRVWEGRPGGVGTPFRGAHASGVNQTYLGFSYIGDSTKQPATAAGVDAMVDLIGWSAARYGFDPRGTITVNGARKPVVAGHYQVGSTSCPGTDLTRRLPSIRETSAQARTSYLAEARARG